MKKYILLALILSGFQWSIFAQRQLFICEGSGVHCMTMEVDGIRISLVKAKGQPEVRVKES